MDPKPDAPPSGTPPATPAGVPGSPPQQDPPPYVPPAAVPATPTYAQGGEPQKGNAISRFFEGITIGDVIIWSLTLCSFFLIIKYYKDKIKNTKEQQSALQAQVDELTMNVKSLAGENYQAS